MGTTGSAPESLGLCSLQTPPPMRPLPRSPQPRMGSGAASVPPGPQPRLQPGGGGVAPPTEPAGPDLTLGAQRVAGASECQRASRVLSPSARSEPFPSTGIPRAPTLCAALAGTCTSHAGRASGGRGSARAGQPTAPQPLLLPLRLPRGQGCQAVPLPPLQCPPLPAESPACRENYSPLSGSNSCAELPASPRPLSRLPGIADCTLTTKATVLAPHVHPDLDPATPDLFLSAFLGGAWETVAEVLGKGGTGRGPEVGWPGQSWLGEGLSWRTCLHGQGLRGRQALCECVIGSVSVRACVCLFRVPE